MLRLQSGHSNYIKANQVRFVCFDIWDLDCAQHLHIELGQATIVSGYAFNTSKLC